MSGFEALGMACAVFQTISFARETTLFCIDIYRGQKTPDSILEENAIVMIQAADQVKVFCKAATTPEEKSLIDVANKCTSVAAKLADEVKRITELHKKGKGNVFVAARGAVESLLKKNKMNDLDNKLRRCTETMQTLLITCVCDQHEATRLKQRQDFDNLDQGLKTFISRIAEGHNRLESLLRDEGQTTREHVTNEATRAVDSVNAQITTQVENREMKEAIVARRQRFLGSFRFKEMNERVNAITDPEDACFDRVLESFEKVAYGKIESSAVAMESDTSSSLAIESDTSSALTMESDTSFEDSSEEIDRLWQDFADWLQSNGQLFWIQGKPGSGKSTLVKYVASKKVTQTLLNQWHPSTRILSHFFWKIGTSLQNDIKGLYCSLLHQLLVGRDELTSSTMAAFPISNYKESYHDWSVPELHSVLLRVLELATDKEHLCIFIDGVDEFVDERGQETIMRLLSDFKRFKKVKLCVTSRPEPWLKEGLDTVPNLKLHDLTAPDMRKWIRGKLQPFERKGIFSPDFSSLLIYKLLDKAGGVFLWIRLATQSILRGIRNKDSEELFISRLEQLPGKLEDLYHDMWNRLGEDQPLYRKSAAEYMSFMVRFRCMKEDPNLEGCHGFLPSDQLTVIRMACANRPDVRRALTAATEVIDYEMLKAICETTGNEIVRNCSGLLEVYPSAYYSAIDNTVPNMMSRIEFVHRTAHDFLVDTEAGQKILSHSEMSDFEMEVLIFYGVLCWLRIKHDKLNDGLEIIDVSRALLRLLALQSSENDVQIMKGLWTTIKSFYVGGILAPSIRQCLLPPFASMMAIFPTIFESEVKDMDQNMATSVLQGIPWHDIRWEERSANPVSGLRLLLSQGADSTAVVSYKATGLGPFIRGQMGESKRTTALWDFLHHTQWVMWRYSTKRRTTMTHVVEIAANMLRSCPSEHQHGLLLGHRNLVAPVKPRVFNSSLAISKKDEDDILPILSANIAYLLDLMLWFLPQKDETMLKNQIQFIRSKIKDPMISLRLLAFVQDGNSLKSFQVVDQLPFQGLVNMIDARERKTQGFGNAQLYDTTISLTEDKSVMVEIDSEHARRTIMGDDLLGSYDDWIVG